MPAAGGSMAWGYHMQYQTKARNLKFGSVTFCSMVYIYTHYYGCFWMVKGLEACMSVGVNQKRFWNCQKVPAPVVKLD